MKKVFKILLSGFMALSLAACGGSDSSADGYEVAMITDSGSVTDKSFNQSAYEGVEEFSKANGLTYKYYKPEATDDAGLISTIDNAIDNGAKVVVTPGFKFQGAVESAAKKYEDIKFITIDFAPSGDYKNVVSYTFAESEPGYLAGYAAVKEGFTKLGFMGGIKLPSIKNFGVGFVQGASDAAKEMGVDVTINYTYTNTFNEDPKILTQATSWYKNGTEIIFSCGGQICNSIFQAAQDTKNKTIGVDTDQSGESDTVLFSALKDVKGSTMAGLQMYKDGNFKAGTVLFDKSGALSYDANNFKNFKQADYDAVAGKIAKGSINLKTADDITSKDKKIDGNPAMCNLPNVTVNYQ